VTRIPPSSQPGIIVLGMHRSGTSAVTRVLNLLGARLSADEDLLGGLFDNPAGHWESKTLVACNERILAAHGGTWDFPPYRRAGWEYRPPAQAMLPELRGTFDELYRHGEGTWVWKDPRTCLTLPLWRQVLTRSSVVLVLRDRDAIVASLRARDRMPTFYGLGLWYHYMREALVGATGMPLVTVHFEELLRSPRAVTDQLAHDLTSLGVPLRGDVDRAVASLQQEHVHWTSSSAGAPGRVAAPLAPRCTTALVAPRLQEPAWVRPALAGYRVIWSIRARARHLRWQRRQRRPMRPTTGPR